MPLILTLAGMILVLSLFSWSYSERRGHKLGENAIYVISIISNHCMYKKRHNVIKDIFIFKMFLSLLYSISRPI